uniref:Uncharacterized protein n=1 Tax=Ditylenchus dipsaci TaxID=166011 RepID=A0A915D4L7_9BILA
MMGGRKQHVTENIVVHNYMINATTTTEVALKDPMAVRTDDKWLQTDLDNNYEDTGEVLLTIEALAQTLKIHLQVLFISFVQQTCLCGRIYRFTYQTSPNDWRGQSTSPPLSRAFVYNDQYINAKSQTNYLLTAVSRFDDDEGALRNGRSHASPTVLPLETRLMEPGEYTRSGERVRSVPIRRARQRVRNYCACSS